MVVQVGKHWRVEQASESSERTKDCVLVERFYTQHTVEGRFSKHFWNSSVIVVCLLSWCYLCTNASKQIIYFIYLDLPPLPILLGMEDLVIIGQFFFCVLMAGEYHVSAHYLKSLSYVTIVCLFYRTSGDCGAVDRVHKQEVLNSAPSTACVMVMFWFSISLSPLFQKVRRLLSLHRTRPVVLWFLVHIHICNKEGVHTACWSRPLVSFL